MKQLKIKKEDQKVFSDLNFEDLPNEVICHVFSYLKIVDILRCGQVSKRFRALSNDEYVWPKKFNLCYKKVPVGFLQKLLYSECKYLSLSESILEGTLDLPKAPKLDRAHKYLRLSLKMPTDSRGKLLPQSILEGALNMKKPSKLKYLNLSAISNRINSDYCFRARVCIS